MDGFFDDVQNELSLHQENDCAHRIIQPGIHAAEHNHDQQQTHFQKMALIVGVQFHNAVGTHQPAEVLISLILQRATGV